MNERDYIVIENILLFSGILFFIIGLFILQTFRINYSFNTMFLLTIFCVFYFFSVYFRFKRYKYNKDMNELLKKYRYDDGKNDNP